MCPLPVEIGLMDRPKREGGAEVPLAPPLATALRGGEAICPGPAYFIPNSGVYHK